MDIEVAGIPLGILAIALVAGYIGYRIVKSYVIMMVLIVIGVAAAGGTLYVLAS